MQVHSPWALAVNARIRERLGVEGAAVASDDGIIARVPDAAAEPPGADLFVFEPDELEQRSEEHTSELQSLMRISYAVFCLKKKKHIINRNKHKIYSHVLYNNTRYHIAQTHLTFAT